MFGSLAGDTFCEIRETCRQICPLFIQDCNSDHRGARRNPGSIRRAIQNDRYEPFQNEMLIDTPGRPGYLRLYR
jgi:hypothetical protein